MHEASLAMSLIDMLVEIAREHRAKRVISCTVLVGKLSGVVVESFTFAFDALKGEYSETEGASLRVEEVPVTYRCSECGFEFEKQDFFFSPCPRCGSCAVDMVKGEEFDLYQVELEE